MAEKPVSQYLENSFVKYVDNTIMDHNDRSDQEEINNLAEWCEDNNLLLNVSTTKDPCQHLWHWGGAGEQF